MNASKIFIVEDQVMTIHILKTYLTEWGYEIAGSARTPEDALKQVEQNPPDLALLDINLGKGMEKGGIELAKVFKKLYHFPIIFLTGQPEMQIMREAKATRPDGYLSKPISEASLSFAIDDALEMASERLINPKPLAEEEFPIKPSEDQSWLLTDDIFVKKGSSYQKTPVSEILWIEADRQYLKIHTHETMFHISTNLANFAHQFEHPSLLRISRRHIINVNHIDGFEENNMVMVAGKAFPIGRTYQKGIQQRFRFLKTSR